MKKKLLALLLAAMMILSVLPAVASAETTTIGETDNTTGWWSAFSDDYTIERGQSKTFTFTNHTDKGGNWHNFIVVLANSKLGSEGYFEYGVMRADNYGWRGGRNTNSTEPETSLPWVLESNWNWDTFKSDLDGASVSVTIEHRGTTANVLCNITKDSKEYHQYYKNIVLDNNPDTITAFFTTENGHLSNFTNSSTGTVTPTIIGNTDFTTAYLAAKSSAWEVKPGHEKTITFTNFNKTDASNWNNYVIGFGSAFGADYAYNVRADNWINNDVLNNDNHKSTTFPDFTSSLRGATVTATIKNEGNVASAVITSGSYEQKYRDLPLNDDGDLVFWLSVDNSYLTYTYEPVDTTFTMEGAPIAQASLTLTDRVGLDFVLSGDLEGISAYINDEATEIKNGKATKSFAAKDFQTNATLTLKDSEGKTVWFYNNGELVSSATTNVKAMCEAYEEQYKANANVFDVAHYMKIYCSLASNYFEKTSIDVSAGDQEYLNIMGDALVADNDIKISQDAEWKAESMYLTLEDQIIMTVVLSKGEGANKETSTWKVRGIEPKNLLVGQTELAYGIINVVPMFYGKLVLQDESGDFEDVKDVVKALYCYALACKDYVPAA